MISNRLKSITKYIDKFDSVIDIGCDHALLDIYLIKNNIVDNLIISDISSSALNQGIDNIIKYDLKNKIFPRLGNGLEVLNDNDNVDTIIISGMGSNTILNILNNKYLNKIKKLVLQSNKDYYILRNQIIKLGFYISKEEFIEDNNKIYINIIFLKGNKNYTNIELKYGTKNMLNRNEYYTYLIKKNNRIIENLNDNPVKIDLENENKLLNILKDEN